MFHMVNLQDLKSHKEIRLVIFFLKNTRPLELSFSIVSARNVLISS